MQKVSRRTRITLLVLAAVVVLLLITMPFDFGTNGAGVPFVVVGPSPSLMWERLQMTPQERFRAASMESVLEDEGQSDGWPVAVGAVTVKGSHITAWANGVPDGQTLSSAAGSLDYGFARDGYSDLAMKNYWSGASYGSEPLKATGVYVPNTTGMGP